MVEVPFFIIDISSMNWPFIIKNVIELNSVYTKMRRIEKLMVS